MGHLFGYVSKVYFHFVLRRFLEKEFEKETGRRQFIVVVESYLKVVGKSVIKEEFKLK